MSKVVSERGTGGATFAAILMILGGGFGLLEGISLIAKGILRPTRQLLDHYERGNVGLVAPDCGSHCSGGWFRGHVWGGPGPLARHHLRKHPGPHKFPVYPGSAVLGDHSHPDRLVDHSLPVRSPTCACVTHRCCVAAMEVISRVFNFIVSRAANPGLPYSATASRPRRTC
jgi:hypothetical protein